MDEQAKKYVMSYHSYGNDQEATDKYLQYQDPITQPYYYNRNIQAIKKFDFEKGEWIIYNGN